MMQLFTSLEIETSSVCNRTCETCIRNSHPDREAVSSWFKPGLLHLNVIKEALDQYAKLTDKGAVCLSHYNEPLMDKRIIKIAELVKSYKKFSVALVTNGDLLTTPLANELDKVFDGITVSLYDGGRDKWVKGLFSKTFIKIAGRHSQTHFSPGANRTAGCRLHRLIINHRRQFLLCCEDVVGNFDLGKFPDISLADFWFGEARKRILSNRKAHPYCSICPRLQREL